MGFDQDRVALIGDSDSLDNVFDLQDDSEDFLFTAKEGSEASAAGVSRDDFAIEEPAPSGPSCKHVLRSMRFIKALYFLGGMNASSWGRYSTIYFNEHGLTASQIGVIEGTMTLVQAIAVPVWGIVADKTRDRKTVSLLTTTLCTCCLMLLAIPAVADGGFWGIFSVCALMSCFVSGSLLDAYTLDLLGEAHRDQFGQFSLWGSLSWGLGALLMGFLTDRYGFNANFVVCGVLSVAWVALFTWYIPRRTALEQSVKASSVRISDLLKAFASWRVIFFFVDIIVFGMGMAFVEKLLFLYILNDLQASTTLCGLTVGVTVLLELPIFHYSDRIMKVMSHDSMFMVAMVAYIFRVLGYTLLTPDTVWFILPLELLHGITFAMMWSAGVACMTAFAPSEWITTAQSIFSTIYFCVGFGIGSVVGGYVMDAYGARTLYRGAAAAVAVLCVIHATVVGVAKLRSRWEAARANL